MSPRQVPGGRGLVLEVRRGQFAFSDGLDVFVTGRPEPFSRARRTRMKHRGPPITGGDIGGFEMKRIASKGAALTVLAILAMSGEASAFTPVPIPKPRIVTASALVVTHGQAHANTGQRP